MADESPNPIEELLRRWARRLYGRRAVLAAVLAVFAAFLLFRSLTWLEAGIGLAAIGLVALLVPRAGESEVRAAARGVGGEAQTETTIIRLADTLLEPSLLLDSRGYVLHRNPAAALQFPTTAPGAPVSFSLRQPALQGAIDAAARTGEAQQVELHQTVPSETWHKVVVSPVAETRLLLVTMQNLTEQKRIDAMRADFIANASHELRTPLTSLVGFIDTLLGPAANDRAARERFLGIMRAQAARMSNLIDDLLSLSRIEMRQHVRPTGKVDLPLLMREVIEGLGTQAAEAGVAIETELPESATVTGERDELYEVFENLIDNAIKYGGGGGRVVLSLAPASGRTGYAWLATVADFGAGIAAEHVPRLTERFYRVDAESSRKKKGTGLGLAIVKHILNRHHGSLQIKSTPGQGTRVEVLLAR